MAYMTQPFTILADTKAGEEKQIRHNRASPMCLADDWAETGHTNIRIIDPDGTERDRRQFRETLTVVKQVRQRARALA